jgi:methylaspartate ammonia-lyase
MKDKLHRALVSKYEAQRDEALATLEVYFNNPAGIGEHPQVVEEMSKMVEKLENAQSCLEQLSSPLLNNY